MGKVVLRPAYAFDCDACGRENFGRIIVPEMSPETEAELRAQYGVEFAEGEFLMVPLEVICSFCGHVSPTDPHPFQGAR